MMIKERENIYAAKPVAKMGGTGGSMGTDAVVAPAGQGEGGLLLAGRRPLRICAIDPGFTGALALLEAGEEPVLVEVVDMPLRGERPKGRTSNGRPKRDTRSELDIAGVVGLLREWRPDVVVIESVGPAPGQGVTSMFRFGFQAGALEAAAMALGVLVIRASPQVWKAQLKIAGGAAGKASARSRATRIWPRWTDAFMRAGDHGRADAALIGWWAWRTERASALVSGAQDGAG